MDILKKNKKVKVINMKNRKILYSLALCILLLSGCGTKQTKPSATPTATAGSTASPDAASTDNETDPVSEITEQDALNKALEHASIKETDLTSKQIKKDREDGKEIYEIEFHTSNKEFEYDIDAETGQILDWEHDND